MQLSNDAIETLEVLVQKRDSAVIAAFLSKLFPGNSTGFVQPVVDAAAVASEDQVERLYRLAITLYAQYFPNEHSAGLAALSRLCALLDDNELRKGDCQAFLEESFPLVMRAAQGLGQVNQYGNDKSTALRFLRNH